MSVFLSHMWPEFYPTKYEHVMKLSTYRSANFPQDAGGQLSPQPPQLTFLVKKIFRVLAVVLVECLIRKGMCT